MKRSAGPAVVWALTLVAAATACAAHWLVRAILPGGGAQYLPFMIAATIASVAWGRRSAGLVLAVGFVLLVVRLATGTVGFPVGAPGIAIGLAGYAALGALIVRLGHIARHHEQESRHARDELERSLTAAGTGSWHFDATRQSLVYSPNIGPMVGRPAGFVHGSLDDWRGHVHPDDLAAVEATLRAARNGESYEFQYRGRTAGGEWCWLLVRGRMERDAAGNMLRADGIVMNMTASRALEVERWRSREELRTMLDLIPAGVAIAHDRTGRNITASPRFARLLRISSEDNASYSREASERLPYRCVRNGVELSGDELPMQVAARTGKEVLDFEVELIFDDGDVLHLLIGAAPLFDTDGTVRGAIGVHTDVTALKLAQRELERADRQKDIFLATLAHELRNPLAPIRYAAATLKVGRDLTVAAEAGRIIERQVAQMSRLLDELLDMSRITRDVVELQREPVDAARIVRSEVEALQPRLAETPRRIEFHGAGSAWILGDETRLHQVVSNLLSNAVKYSRDGGHIVVSMAVEGRSVHLMVRDDGIGLAAADLPHVFDLFSQIRKPGHACAGGLGIGLAVVRRLVELHGGEIAATSDGPDRGATFTVRLPLMAAPVAQVVGVRPTPGRERPSVAGNGMRVLVVDDNADAADSLAVLLRDHGFVVQVAHDGQEALRAAEAARPDVAVLDLGLPDLSGEEVARRIRATAWGQGVELVAVTGWGQPHDRARTAAAGFAHHLVKPVEPAELLEVLAALTRTSAASHLADA